MVKYRVSIEKNGVNALKLQECHSIVLAFSKALRTVNTLNADPNLSSPI